jgi:hypothetical protein
MATAGKEIESPGMCDNLEMRGFCNELSDKDSRARGETVCESQSARKDSLESTPAASDKSNPAACGSLSMGACGKPVNMTASSRRKTGGKSPSAF